MTFKRALCMALNNQLHGAFFVLQELCQWQKE
jgi:hypothetical protein